MKLLDRYVIRELALPFCIGLTVGVMLLTGTMLFAHANDIITKDIPLSLVAKLVLLKIPSSASTALPMAMAMAAALAVNRLASDAEFGPMRMAGVSFRRITAPIFAVGLAGSVASYVLTERVGPIANDQANKIVWQMMLQSVVPTAQPNVFLRAEGYTFYIGTLSKQGKDRFRLRDVQVYDTTRLNGFPVWYAAREADTTRGKWVLRDVVRRDITPSGERVHETYLPELTINLEKDQTFFSGPKPTEAMSSHELRNQLDMLKTPGMEQFRTPFLVEYHFRFALPLACLIFGLLSAPVSFRFSRGGTFVGVLVAIIVAFLYWVALILCKEVLGRNGLVHPLVAAWGMNVVFGAIAAFMVWKTG